MAPQRVFSTRLAICMWLTRQITSFARSPRPQASLQLLPATDSGQETRAGTAASAAMEARQQRPSFISRVELQWTRPAIFLFQTLAISGYEGETPLPAS